jgi:hypothetical protein
MCVFLEAVRNFASEAEFNNVKEHSLTLQYYFISLYKNTVTAAIYTQYELI